MKKHLLLFYSKTGNSRFIATKLAKELSCDVASIQPSFNFTGLLFLLSLLKIRIPTNITTKRISEYQEIILIGPIWGGLLIAPLRTVLKKCVTLSKPVHFAITCESGENDKDSQYGYNQVLKTASQLGGSLVKTTAAFSTALTKGYEGKIKSDITVKTKFTEENYSDELKTRLKDFQNEILKSSKLH